MKGPVLTSVQLNLPLPSPEDKRADLERLKQSLGIGHTEVPLGLLRQLPSRLRQNHFKLTPVLARLSAQDHRLVALDQKGPLLAVAIDIGSTNIVGSLWDLRQPEPLQTGAIKNPQVAFGADVLTRMHQAITGRAEQLHRALLEGVNSLIKDLAEKTGVRAEEVLYCSIAGNTVMTHFLLDLPVEYIPIEPYIPVVHQPNVLDASALQLDICPHAPVYIFPNAGSYVGGDIIAGIIATGLHRADVSQVLLDIGTNGEVVIGTKDWVFVGSGAAGPALEAGVLKAGMAAKEGAIYRVDLEGERFSLKTIADAEPVGICGSGVIDLVAELFRANWIDSYGRFTERAPVKDIGGQKVIVVAETRTGIISISEDEIENFLRSKAGMFTTLYVMVTELGLRFSDIERFYIAGAMGTGVRLGRAKLLGMLPDVPEDKVEPVGNSSLKGSEALLKNSSVMEEVERLLGIITYKEMNADTRFMSLFRSAMVIPHADPSVLR